MRGKYVAPGTGQTAFNCPHCGTLTKQRWFLMQAQGTDDPPAIWTPEKVEALKTHRDDVPDDTLELLQKLSEGLPFISRGSYEGSNEAIYNLFVTRCDECRKLAVWMYDKLLWPHVNHAPEPSVDMPEEILADYLEAASILDASPRGTAALLRLCIQKLCAHLLGNETTGKIDKDIALLVSQGLDKRVEMALDIVRVVGNESVHPGKMDMKDDRATAQELFGLVNIIVETMITQPKRIAELYSKLPTEKLKGIEQRNAQAALPKPK